MKMHPPCTHTKAKFFKDKTIIEIVGVKENILVIIYILNIIILKVIYRVYRVYHGKKSFTN